jgi:branched-chain amino acid transport system permease protein
MRFVFKTSYDQDIRMFPHGGAVFWYGALIVALIAAPLVLDRYLITQASFVAIYTIAGVGLMLLAGYTGQVSLGHAAFLAAGSYTEAILMDAGVPFLISLPCSGLLAGALGIVIGLPALRLAGIYLAIATLAFAFIVEEILARWESLTGGTSGLMVPELTIAGVSFYDETNFYYLCVGVAVLVMLAAINLLRSPTGRAWIAIRDSEIAAQSMGVNLAWYKTMAFAISAGFTGLAGALLAHQLSYISPESYNILLSVELLLLVVVGGLGSLHGAVFGAIFIIVLPEMIAMLQGALPEAMAQKTGLKSGVFGLVIVLFMLYEPLGIYGRWRKVKHYFAMFPMYRKATFKRQKSYVKSDRLR